jgi:hypothetical protein
MTELRSDLERIARLAPQPDDAYARFLNRKARRARNQRLAAGGLALAVTGGALGGMMITLRGEGHGGIRPAEGFDGTLRMQPGEYSYRRISHVYPSGITTEENWWALDGSGRIELVADAGNYGVPNVGTYGPGEFPVGNEMGDVSDLSTDPKTLAEQIRERSAPNGASPQPAVTPEPGQAAETGGLWRAMGALLLVAPDATPELQAALFQVAEGITGVERVDGAVDPVGRAAIVLRLHTESGTQDLFFDPSTFLVMGSAITLDADTEAGAGPFYEVVEEAAFVPSTDDRPEQAEDFFPRPVGSLPTVGEGGAGSTATP